MINLLLMIGIINSLIPLIKKYLLSQLAFHEFLLINNLFVIILVLIVSLYYFLYKKETFENLKKINKKNLFLIGFIAFITVLSSYILSNINIDNVTNIGTMGIVLNLFTNIFILILGFLIFNEQLTNNKILGIMFCLFGIYLTNKK